MQQRSSLRLPTLLILSILVLPIILLSVSGCTTPVEETPPQPVDGGYMEELPPTATLEPALELIDGLDREVVMPAPADRIISLSPSNTEILFAIGAGDQVVGREEYSDYPDAALSVESIGSVYGDINTEAILALDPDLILAAEINTPEQVAMLADLGLTVFYISNPVNFIDLFDNILLVGRLTGHEEEAAALTESLAARVDAVEEMVTGTESVTVYYEVDATDVAAPYTAGASTFQDMLIARAGGINIASDLEGYPQISQEELILRNPDVMIFGASPWVTTTGESVAERPGWDAISAVAEGRIFGVDSNWVDRPGPRLVDALEAFAGILHPDMPSP